eukprot:gene15549-651_t
MYRFGSKSNEKNRNNDIHKVLNEMLEVDENEPVNLDIPEEERLAPPRSKLNIDEWDPLAASESKVDAKANDDLKLHIEYTVL